MHVHQLLLLDILMHNNCTRNHFIAILHCYFVVNIMHNGILRVGWRNTLPLQKLEQYFLIQQVKHSNRAIVFNSSLNFTKPLSIDHDYYYALSID